MAAGAAGAAGAAMRLGQIELVRALAVPHGVTDGAGDVAGAVRVGLARRRTPLAVDQRASAVAPHRHARDTVDRLIAAGRMIGVAVVADCSRLLAGRRSAGHRGVEVVILTESICVSIYSFTHTR